MKRAPRSGLHRLFAAALILLGSSGCAGNGATPNPGPRTLEVYAHRGARSFAPENSIPGYAAGLAIGTHWVDMDVVMTRDGEVLVSHDIRLNPDIVRDAAAAFITDTEAREGAHACGGAGLRRGPPQPGHRLRQVLPGAARHGRRPHAHPARGHPPREGRTGGKVGFQIEFKTNPEHPDWTYTPAEFAAALHRILSEEGIVETSEIQSFDWRCLYELQKLDARVKTAYLTEWDNEPGTPYSFFDPDPAKAGLWTGGVLVKDHGNSIPQMVKDMGGTCWEPEDVELTKETLDEAHRLGLKVVVWTWPEHSGTVFDAALVRKLIDWGVDGIITDDPGQLISMLAARGYALPATYR